MLLDAGYAGGAAIAAGFEILALLFSYAFVAHVVNSSVIETSDGVLTVRNGPLPWWGSRTLTREAVARLAIERLTSRVQIEGGDVRRLEALCVIDRSGRRQRVLTFDEAGQAEIVREELSRALASSRTSSSGFFGTARSRTW